MKLFSREFGNSSNPPILVFHGLLGSSRNWQGAGSDLGKRFYVNCLDLRNHGKSPHVSPHSYDGMMGDVLSWMDERGLLACPMIGHSMGGKLAMKIACERPDRVRRLVIVDIVPKRYPRSHDSEYDAMRSIDLGGLSSRKEADQRLEAAVPDWGKRQFLLTNLTRNEGGTGFSWIVNIDALEASQREIESSPIGAGSRFEGETLFLMGGRSSYSNPSDYPGLKRIFPKCQVDVIPESGHNPHIEVREEFVSRVTQFLESSEVAG